MIGPSEMAEYDEAKENSPEIEDALSALQTVVNMCEGHPEWGDTCHGIFLMGRDNAQRALATIRQALTEKAELAG